MKVYRIYNGILIENKGIFYLLEGEDWDSFINDDNLFKKIEHLISGIDPVQDPEVYVKKGFLAPAENQEIWASGVTYFNSKLGREEESREKGGSNFYARVYVAERPELFFKSMGYRAVGSGGKVRIRKDSTWDVPEPELTLLISSEATIEGYTIGNDMSSRSIEGENPLYLPQAKTYEGCAALGPCIYVTKEPLDPSTMISMEIERDGMGIFSGNIPISNMKRRHTELVEFLFRECSFANGCFLMTGTGIIPPDDFTLKIKDEIRITIDGIGTLTNFVG